MQLQKVIVVQVNVHQTQNTCTGSVSSVVYTVHKLHVVFIVDEDVLSIDISTSIVLLWHTTVT